MRRALLPLVLCACGYSPPVRTPSYGAPGRLREGQIELAAGAAGIFSTDPDADRVADPFAGGPRIGYGVRDWAAVEAGGEFSRLGWALGFLGGRFTRAPRRDEDLHGALDLEVGVGAGAGGEPICPESPCSATSFRDPTPWHRRLALGAYLGGGAAYHIHFFALWTRVRVQAAAADRSPSTLWYAVHGGIQFRVAERIDLHAGVGYGGYKHVAHGHHQLLFDLGLAVFFDPRGRRRVHARRPTLLSF